MDLDAIIDLSRYPINVPGSEALAKMVEVTRTSYLRDGIVSFYRLEDPLGSASINISPPGTAQNWHFDEVLKGFSLLLAYSWTFQSVFSVTIMIQKPDSGGLFRNTKPIRVKGEEDDDFYDVLDRIVNGSDDIAETLSFEPGTLSIFCGSRCLHEVTRVGGSRDRLVAVFCFATRPGGIIPSHTSLQFGDRNLPSVCNCI